MGDAIVPRTVAVLLQIYATCISGQEDAARQRIADAFGEPGRGRNFDTYSAQPPGGHRFPPVTAGQQPRGLDGRTRWSGA
ncbi:hypothetical protein WY02_20795 [Pseudonocardia sp. AL041005-10]|nr:hypothetical protein WY02_20795 [Pseudonocardia sp. AL041005-10]